MKLHAVRLRGSADTSVSRVEPIDWPYGFDDFLEVGPTKADKLAAPAWMPATVRPGGRRCDSDITHVHALVLDYDVDDRGISAEDILDRWDGYERVLHSTWTPGRWRVILPYDRPLTPAEHARVYAWAVEREGGLIDGSCKNPSRLFFWPCVREDVDDEPTFGYTPGELLGVEAVARTSDLREGPLVVVPPSSSPPSVHPNPSLASGAASNRGPLPGIPTEAPPSTPGGGRTPKYTGIDHPEQRESVDLIESRCAFMRRAKDEAASLPEPEWYAALSVWSRCKGADEVAHERSRPYAGYSEAETQEKLERARSVGPATCAYVRSISPACAGCPLQVTSPVLLGREDPAPAPVDAEDTSLDDERAAAEEALEEARGGKRAAMLAREQARRRLTTLRSAGALASDDDLAAAVEDKMAADEACIIAERTYKAREKDLAAIRSRMSVDGLPAGADPAVWQRLRLVDGRPVDSVANVLRVLSTDPAWGRRLSFNEFSNDVLLDNEPLPETEAPRLALTLYDTYRLETTTPRVTECVRTAADEARTHPVRDWLRSLKWDGVSRVDRLTLDGFRTEVPAGSEMEPLVSLIGRKLLVAMVARVMRPGCKMDTMVVLTGGQGAFKSTVLETLVPDKAWFARTKLDLTNKDGFLALRGKWLYEFAELSSMKKTEAFISKGWLSNDVDTYRAPYARRAEDHPRQTVPVGTDNEGEFLVDATGSRRFHPLPVTLCDVTWVAENRDQLFAEAVVLYGAGETWWFDERSEMAERLRRWSAPFASTHPWTETVTAWLRQSAKKTPTFSAVDVLTRALGKQPGDLTNQDQLAVTNILRHLQCPRVERDVVAGQPVTLYQHPTWLLDSLPTATVLSMYVASDKKNATG